MRDLQCVENTYCEYGYFIPVDKEIVQSGFNLFILLLKVKNLYPEHEALKKFNLSVF